MLESNAFGSGAEIAMYTHSLRGIRATTRTKTWWTILDIVKELRGTKGQMLANGQVRKGERHSGGAAAPRVH